MNYRKKLVSIFFVFAMIPLFAGNSGQKLKDDTMERPPLLRLTEDGYRLIWNNNSENKPEVFLENSSGLKKSLDVKKGTVGKKNSGFYVDLENLEPDTKYTVEISGYTKIDFESPKKENENFKFAIISDHQTYIDLTRKGFETVCGDKPDFIISSGDMLEDGILKNWKKNFFANIPIFQGIPFAASMGNNDVGSCYFESFLSLDKSYYAANYGGIKFIFLDSNKSLAPDSKQFGWLKKTLEKNHSKWTVVVYHHGSFVSVKPNPSVKKYREELLELFEKNDVDFVLNGHNHLYDRTSPIKGVTFITVPSMSGIQNKYKINMESGYYEKTIQEFNGYGIVTVSGNTMVFRIKDLDEKIIDVFEIKK